MAIDTVRVSKEGRDHLIRMKAKTGIQQWNILCRWALCMSLAEPSAPPQSDIRTDSSLEMAWTTFGGAYRDTLTIILKERALRDLGDSGTEQMQRTLNQHLHRGIGYLFGEKSLANIADLVATVAET